MMVTNEEREHRRRLLCQWLTANGVDPNLVPADSALEYSADRTRLRYEQVLLNQHGQPALDAHDRPICEQRTVTIVVPYPEELRS